jgi:hypothetical protein
MWEDTGMTYEKNSLQHPRHTSGKGSSYIKIKVSRKLYGHLKCKKKKSKAVPLHAMEADGERGGIAPTHS